MRGFDVVVVVCLVENVDGQTLPADPLQHVAAAKLFVKAQKAEIGLILVLVGQLAIGHRLGEENVFRFALEFELDLFTPANLVDFAFVLAQHVAPVPVMATADGELWTIFGNDIFRRTFFSSTIERTFP